LTAFGVRISALLFGSKRRDGKQAPLSTVADQSGPGFALRQLIDRIADSRRQGGIVEVDPQQIFVVDRSTLASLAPSALLEL
jgi:hypothetical protein